MSTARPTADAYSRPRTVPASADVDAFIRRERTAESVAAKEERSAEPVADERVARTARLSVDIPASVLRRLKIRAIENRVTVREYVIALLERDGLA